MLTSYYACTRQVYLRGCDEDGTSMAEQWSIVGDTCVTYYGSNPNPNQVNPNLTLILTLTP